MKKADFNMKKLWIISVAALLAVSLTACGTDLSASRNASASSQTSQAQSAASADDSAVEDNLAGLQKYLTANASVAGTPEEMRSDMIGAKAGVRYKYDYNGKNNVTLELYEFDTKKLNDTAKKVISDVKSTGKFTVIGQQVNAVLSNSGKYLMIYNNSLTDDANKAYGEKIKKLFTEFKANG
jgi:hypothetical protein